MVMTGENQSTQR